MNYHKIASSLALVTGVLTAQAFAQDEATPADNAVGDIANRFYLSPMFSYTFAGKDRRTDDAGGGLFAIGKQMNPYADFELYGSYNRYGSKIEGSGSGELLTLGLAFAGFPFANSRSGLGKWLGGAYGLIGVNWADGSDLPLRQGYYDQNRHGYALDFGAGYLSRIPFIRIASLRLDVRYRMNFVTNPFASVELHDGQNDKPNINDVVVSVGMLVPIGAKPKSPPPPPPPEMVAPVAPPDADGDGVADMLDQCPDTPAGENVDDTGCSPPPSTPSP